MSKELACYAVSESLSRGRKFAEKPHPYRSAFGRDRDRIVHCSAFRRLEGKTQVFALRLGEGSTLHSMAEWQPGDHYRTRMTHSIEVAQIGRTIADQLGLNEVLTEAICLAHDLGHSPFGHAGEKVLNSLMVGFGGFEHNRQTLRIVDLLEHPYPDFGGLNLMYETRLGLAKHRGTYDDPMLGTFPERNCSLEGQVADIADRIAYNCHDLEDGMCAGLIEDEQLERIEIFEDTQRRIGAGAIKDQTVRRTRTAKAIIDELVSDCIDASKKNIARIGLKTIKDVYAVSENLIMLSAESDAELVELENFLLQNFYRHKSLMRIAEQARNWLERLFEKLCQNCELMPGYFQRLVAKEGLQRTVCDYIAGMTDRFCLEMLEKSKK